MLRWCLVAALVAVTCGSSGPPPAHEYEAGDAQDGTPMSVHAGDSIRVTLASTAWTFNGTSDPTVVQQVGVQVTSPAPAGTCVAGAGCGTTTAVFRAIKRGKSTIQANRVSCGEARVCVGPEGTYTLAVVVA
jgi:hypothetical protein